MNTKNSFIAIYFNQDIIYYRLYLYKIINNILINKKKV